jgi:MFS family permease
LFGLFDNKVLFIIGVLLFEVGSAVCASSPNMTALIIGRVVCGLGGVGIFVGTMNLLSFFTTEKERPIYLNIVGLTWGAGTMLVH